MKINLFAMKPSVGVLVFCSGRFCVLLFIFNIAFAVATCFLNGSIIVALTRIAKKKSWKVPNVILCSLSITDFLTGLLCQPFMLT